MVPHPTIKGLEVSIQANGRDLPVYYDVDATPEPNVVTRYVLASSEQDFMIRYGFWQPAEQAVCVKIYINGTFVHSIIYEKPLIKKRFWNSIKGPRCRDGEQWFEQQFRFKDLSVTSRDGNGASDTKELGTIKVVLRYGVAERDVSSVFSYALQDQQEVSEKKLKGQAKSLHVGPSPGPRIKITEPSWFHFEPDGGPFATFLFKYRSRKDLEALGVIPRPSSPSNEDWKVKSEPDIKSEPNIKNEPGIKNETDMKPDPETKNEPKVEERPSIKRESSPTGELNASRRSPDTSQLNIKREPGLEEDNTAAGETDVPAKRELEDAEEPTAPEKKIKQEDEDE